MSPKRPLRVSTNQNGRGVAPKRHAADNISPVPRTRACQQLKRIIPTFPSKGLKSAPSSPKVLKSASPPKVPKSAPSSPSKRPPSSSPSSSHSRRNLPKKTSLRNTRSSPVKITVVKKSPQKLSSKSVPVATSIKKKVQSTEVSTSGNNVKTTPKKVPPKSSPTSGKNVKTTPNKVNTRRKTSSVKNVTITPKKILIRITTSSEKNIQTSPKKVPLKTTSSTDNSKKSTPQKGLPKTPVINARSPMRQISTRSSPLSKASSPTSSPYKDFVNSSPSKTPNKVSKLTLKQTGSSPVSPGRLTRKRLLPSPSKSPQAVKRRSRGNILTPLHVKNEADSGEDCMILDEVPKLGLQPHPGVSGINSGLFPKAPIQFKSPFLKKTGAALPSDPELSGRFLRRKWFSLKTRGGFTCLRSAILSPEEIAQEVIQHTMVETPKYQDANFFSTKLMVRLSSRLPPSRARPSCEELVDLINSKQTSKNASETKEPRKEGTAIRVKVERRSFSDTISHVTNKPSENNESGPNGSPSRIGGAFPLNHGNLTKKEEREIALQQLKNLRYW